MSSDDRAGDGEERGKNAGRTSRHLLCLESTVSGLSLLNPQKPQGNLLVKIERARGLSILRGLTTALFFLHYLFIYVGRTEQRAGS